MAPPKKDIKKQLNTDYYAIAFSMYPEDLKMLEDLRTHFENHRGVSRSGIMRIALKLLHERVVAEGASFTNKQYFKL